MERSIPGSYSADRRREDRRRRHRRLRGAPRPAGGVDTADGAGCLGNGFICSHRPRRADDYGHGTHVSGIAAAATNNGTGIAGLALNSTIIPVKVCDSGGSCSDSSIANGIAWAVAHGARVINLSLGGYGFSKTMCDAVKAANAQGAVVAAATGNDGDPRFPSYPAACPGAIGVGATGNDDDNIAWFSNWDYPGVFVTAPGGNDFDPSDNDATTQILSTVPFSLLSFGPALYQSIEGTSMSTPYVSGLAALLLSQRPGRTPADVAACSRRPRTRSARSSPTRCSATRRARSTARTTARTASVARTRTTPAQAARGTRSGATGASTRRPRSPAPRRRC